MHDIDKHVCELRYAENNFIQTLLSTFLVTRSGDNKTLHLALSDTTPTIRRREAKGVVKNHISDFKNKSLKYQGLLDDILLNNTLDTLEYHDEDFLFRYGSGGSLPVIKYNNKTYYCLFYRDIYPAGWNIASGATDSVHELFSPFETVLRELQEELFIVNPSAGEYLLFDPGISYLFEFQEVKTAFDLWEKTPLLQGFHEFAKKEAKVAWIHGPDRVVITYNDRDTATIEGGFLNINAVDFGIEVDKVVEIAIDDNYILIDGELNDNRLLDRPIGLFDVTIVNEKLRNNETEFLPDIIFHTGEQYPGTKINELILDKFIPDLCHKGIRNDHKRDEWCGIDVKFNLCPIARGIIKRYMKYNG